MSYFDPEEFKREYESATPDYGDDGSPLPRGWYPLRVFPVKIDETQNGVPRVLLSVTVTHGPKTGRQFLQEQYLTASHFERKEVDGEWVTQERDEDTFKQKAKAATYRIKGFMDACGLEVNEMAQGDGESEFLVNYFDVESWKNARVMGNVDIRKNDKNQIKGFRPLDDEKYGLDAWLARQEAKNS